MEQKVDDLRLEKLLSSENFLLILEKTRQLSFEELVQSRRAESYQT